MIGLLKLSHSPRRRRAACVLSAGCFVLAVPGMAAASPGPLDTVEVATAPPVDAVEETLDAVLEPLRDAAPPMPDPAADAVDTVVDSVDEGTAPVDDVTNEPPTPVTDVVDDTTATDPDHRSPRIADPAQPTGAVRSVSIARERRSNGVESRAPDTRPTPADSVPAPLTLPTTPLLSRPEHPDEAGSTGDQITRAVVDASRAFRFPLLVAAGLLLFLGVQGRLDSRDPKLAQDRDDEELMFA